MSNDLFEKLCKKILYLRYLLVRETIGKETYDY